MTIETNSSKDWDRVDDWIGDDFWELDDPDFWQRLALALKLGQYATLISLREQHRRREMCADDQIGLWQIWVDAEPLRETETGCQRLEFNDGDTLVFTIDGHVPESAEEAEEYGHVVFHEDDLFRELNARPKTY